MKKGCVLMPLEVQRLVKKLSKAAALDLAYSLAGLLVKSADSPIEVYEQLRSEWAIVAVYRYDKQLPSWLDIGTRGERRG